MEGVGGGYERLGKCLEFVSIRPDDRKWQRLF